MFSGQLDRDYYDLPAIRQAFLKAIERNAKITIVAEKMGNRNFMEFTNKKGINVRVLKKRKDKLRIKEWGHFLRVGSAFRIEKPHPLAECIAEGSVNFSNSRIGSTLGKAFDSLVANSEEATV